MRILVTILCLAISATAHAANLPALRSEVASAAARAQGLSDQRAQLERTLGEVASRIEALKFQRAAQGALFRDPELDELLKQSQELSTRLSALLEAERDAKDGLASREASLGQEIDTEIDRLRARWDKARNGDERRALIPLLRQLKNEREALRRGLPATALPAAVPDSASDDPQELLERADALLDSEDKLRREEQALAARIKQLKEERELERRMGDFLGESSLFDEQDRRISVTRSTPAQSDGYRDTSATAPQTGESSTTTPAAPTSGDPREPSTGGYDNSLGTESGLSGGSSEAAPLPHDSGSPGRQDGLGTIGGSTSHTGFSRTPPDRQSGLSAYSDDESAEELEARRAQIRALADELHHKAEQTSRQARDLL